MSNWIMELEEFLYGKTDVMPPLVDPMFVREIPTPEPNADNKEHDYEH